MICSASRRAASRLGNIEQASTISVYIALFGIGFGTFVGVIMCVYQRQVILLRDA